MNDRERLDPRTLEVMSMADGARLSWIKEDHWIDHLMANRILAELQDLLDGPRVIRPPCNILLGSTQGGKTSMLKEFFARNPFVYQSGPHGVRTPVVYTIAPTKPEEALIEESILQGYESRFHPKGAPQRREILSKAIKNGGLQVLLVDEIQQTFKGTSTRNLDVLELYKDYANRFGISVVLAGTPEAYLPVHTDTQLSNRFKPIFIHPWTPGPEVLSFIAAYERLLPLKHPSGLTSREIAPYLFEWMEGMVGELVDLLREAAKAAIRTGEERITLDLLKSLPLLPASKRKSSAETYFRHSGLVFPEEVHHG